MHRYLVRFFTNLVPAVHFTERERGDVEIIRRLCVPLPLSHSRRLVLFDPLRTLRLDQDL